MNCLAFERLLDEGTPDRLPAEALAHARACAACARSLARARSLEAALERHFASALGPAPALEETLERLTERVMARVEGVEAHGARWLALPDALPWWVRAAAEPPVALAGALAALLLWRGDALIAAARTWAGGGTAAPAPLGALLERSGLGRAAEALARSLAPGPDANWAVVAAFVLGIAPLLALAGVALWRAGERIAGGAGAVIAR